jgi:riboflavin synthase
MFTGIVEAIGTVRAIVRLHAGAQVEIAAPALAPTMRLGDSLAVDGACLTVTACRGDALVADLSTETLRRTTLGRLRIGSPVNLERPLRLGDRLGGHLVTGHVDAVGHLAGREAQGAASLVRVRFPHPLAPLLVLKGSVAVDGISLTVAELIADQFAVAVIPYTLRGTTLGGKPVGAEVNLEADIIGKHVARFVERGERPHGAGLTQALLEEYGFA